MIEYGLEASVRLRRATDDSVVVDSSLALGVCYCCYLQRESMLVIYETALGIHTLLIKDCLYYHDLLLFLLILLLL